jgi:hypothetical protein
VFRLTLPRTAGAELAGSPLPLAPDDAELADAPAAGTPPDADDIPASLAAVLPSVIAAGGPAANGSAVSRAGGNGAAGNKLARGAGPDQGVGPVVADPDLAAALAASATDAGPAAPGYDGR